MDWGKFFGALGDTSQVAGSAAANAAQGRIIEQQANNDRDRVALERYRTDLALPQLRAQDATRASVLANSRDSYTSHPRANVVHFTGGMKPSLLSPDARTVGRDQVRKAMLAQLAGAGAPSPTPVPESSWWEKGLGALGTGGSLLSTLGNLFRGGGGVSPNAGENGGGYGNPVASPAAGPSAPGTGYGELWDQGADPYADTPWLSDYGYGTEPVNLGPYVPTGEPTGYQDGIPTYGPPQPESTPYDYWSAWNPQGEDLSW